MPKIGYKPTDIDETLEILHEEWLTSTVASKADLVVLLENMLEVARQVIECDGVEDNEIGA